MAPQRSVVIECDERESRAHQRTPGPRDQRVGPETIEQRVCEGWCSAEIAKIAASEQRAIPFPFTDHDGNALRADLLTTSSRLRRICRAGPICRPPAPDLYTPTANSCSKIRVPPPRRDGITGYSNVKIGIGGEGGIRTLDTLSSTHAFQACAFNHSATSPADGKTYCQIFQRRNLVLDFY